MDKGRDGPDYVKSETDDVVDYDGRSRSPDCGNVDDSSTIITGRSFASIPHLPRSSGDDVRLPDDALASFSGHRKIDASNASITDDLNAFSAHQPHFPHTSNDNDTVVTGRTFPGESPTSLSPDHPHVSSHRSKAVYMAELIERGREADKRSYDTLMEQIELKKEFGFLVFSASFTSALLESGD